MKSKPQVSANTALEVEPFYHTLTGAYAYLAYDSSARRAVVIDPVLDFDRRSGAVATDAADAILQRIRELSLEVAWVLETHAHADHISAAAYMKEWLGCAVATGAGIRTVQVTAAKLFGLHDLPTDGSPFDRLWNDGDRFSVGSVSGTVLATPGHTPDSVTYLIGDCLFVGDTLFLPDVGTARCDFPGGNAAQLFASVQSLYRLPDETRVMVGHDYPPTKREPVHISDLRSQRRSNVHLSENTTREAFIEFRQQRDRTLALPELFFFALQANIRSGKLPPAHADGSRYFRVPIRVPRGWPR
jgi:glyoxylase-like metal-dependent hydrolase (beta-lactamase superfamily II)